MNCPRSAWLPPLLDPTAVTSYLDILTKLSAQRMKPTGSEMPLYPDFLRERQESSKTMEVCRAVGRSENPGRGHVVCNMVGIICPLVEIRLTDLPKSWRGGGHNTPGSDSPEYLL